MSAITCPDALRVSAGLRYTQDDKTAAHEPCSIAGGCIDWTTSSRDWSETSWDLSANYQLSDRMNVYGTIQSGYQSGQFPPRPFCLFGSSFWRFPTRVDDPNYCFVANDNVTALNYEVGIKGQPLDNLQMSVSVFYTNYSDLPYQVSTTAGGGRLQHRQHHRRPDLDGRRVGGHLAGHRRLPPALDARLHRRRRGRPEPAPQPSRR